MKERPDPSLVRGRSARLRVLLVGQGAPSLGGIPSFVDGLLRNDRLSEIVSFRFLNTTPSREKRPGALTVGNLAQLLHDVGSVWRLAPAADVVHLNLAPDPLLPLARAFVLAAAAKLRGAPVVLHAHTGRLHRFVDGWAFRLMLRATVAVVDRFVVVAEPERLAVSLVTNDSPKVIEMANAVDVSRFRTGPKAKPPRLVFVGTVCERKGLIDLRDALVELSKEGLAGPRRLEVAIIGDDEQEGPGALERIRGAYASLGWVSFEGALPVEGVVDALAAAAIFCLPSHWEAFPMSVLEAMASETAVVATRVGDVPRILDGGRAGRLVDPFRPDQLAAAIRELLSGEEWRRVGRAGGLELRRRFTADVLAARLGAEYVAVGGTVSDRRLRSRSLLHRTADRVLGKRKA
jgi:glycosyltransferase involved in cell wall biosynthesis